jgi:large subunit ribosomal protein L9
MANYLRVVLTEDLHNLGKSGELVRVRPGFARNYLLPRGLAVAATQENVAQIEHAKKVAEARAAKTRAEAEELSKKLSGLKVELVRPAGDGDKLYGAVTTRDIEQALSAQGFTVDKRRIELGPVKTTGTYTAVIKLASSITASVSVIVKAK